jgi:protein O-GlcNAc transferase
VSEHKPRLRMIHNLARSGGTLMSKCLGCMEGVILLSEIHPAATQMFNPLAQAAEWHNLLSDGDKAELQRRGSISFVDAIDLILRRAEERGGKLVLRDWAHLDYTGYPYVTTPGYRPALYDALADRFDIIRVSMVRDPVDQWQSLIMLSTLQAPMQRGEFNLAKFLSGYRKYAELCVQTGFFRYEDFLRQPEKVMRELCARLQIGFDPDFINKWHRYTKIGGDVDSRGVNAREIKLLPRRPVTPELREAFLASEDYRASIGLLGYASL